MSEWYRVDEGGSAGELPGLGGWASITDVKGKGKKYSYTDADGDWVAYEWTQDGSVTTDAGGLVDALVVGGGGSGGGATDSMGGGPGCGGAGGFLRSVTLVSDSVDLVVGSGGVGSTTQRICNDGENSTLGTLVALGGGRGALTNSTSNSTLSPGGSGGGGAYVNASGSNGRGISLGMGNDGGLVWNGSRGGGGGGAATSAGVAGQGGDGFIDTITGSPVGYAGGGWYREAGAPPVDFGAGHSAAGASGRAGSGSGGAEKGSGGSGVVIVRVPKANDLFKDIPGSAAGEPFDIPTTRQAVAAALEEKVEAVKDTMIIDGRETKIKRNRKR